MLGRLSTRAIAKDAHTRLSDQWRRMDQLITRFDQHEKYVQRMIKMLYGEIENIRLQVFGDDNNLKAVAPALLTRVDHIAKALGSMANALDLEYFFEKTPAQPEVIKQGFRKPQKQKTKK